MLSREQLGGMLSDRTWQARVLDETWRQLGKLSQAGYPVVRDASGAAFLRIGQAPQYMHFMRTRLKRCGVTILDHSPALSLLRDSDGVVRGALGVQRQLKQRFRVRASAVVLATGGCTWKSKSLGGDVDTGDGQLMAAEVGAHLSGMEFSAFYGIVPRYTSMDKNGYYGFASFSREDGSAIEGDLFGSRAPLLRAASQGQTYAQFDKAPQALRPVMRRAMPNFFMVLDKLRVDPFTQRFAIDFVLEGTVRGTGGLHLRDADCWTGIPGLYAAGDTASREVIVGGATGAGAPNAAWAVSSGTWAGAAAARYAKSDPLRDAPLTATGRVGFEPSDAESAGPDWNALQRGVQAEMLPIDKSAFRAEGSMRESLRTLDGLWREAARGTQARGLDETIKLRESVGMLAMARWAYASALARTESRAMHTRTDYPQLDPAQGQRILSGGLDELWTARDPQLPSRFEQAKET
jgi:succinate dehydrogenase/fumarate reductase flavoprotein subunit